VTGAYLSHSPEETRSLARRWAQALPGGSILLLHGDLGAGKTCFVQGLAEGLGWDGAVTSPTYTLVQEYSCSPRLIHADLYRLSDEEELYDLGFEEWLRADTLLAVEWSERVSFWPDHAWQLWLENVPGEPDQRRIRVEGGPKL